MARVAAQLGDAFCDHTGGVSSMRIMSVLVCVIVLGAWIMGMVAAGHYIPLGVAEAGLIGMACGAKAAQSRFELGSGGVWGAPPPPGSDVTAPAPEPVPTPRDLLQQDTGGI